MRSIRFFLSRFFVLSPGLLAAQISQPAFVFHLPGMELTGGISPDRITFSHITATNTWEIEELVFRGRERPTLQFHPIPGIEPKPGDTLSFAVGGGANTHYVAAIALRAPEKPADALPDEEILSLLDPHGWKVIRTYKLTANSDFVGWDYDNWGFFLDNFVTLTYAKDRSTTRYRAFRLPDLTPAGTCERKQQGDEKPADPCAAFYKALGARDFDDLIDTISGMGRGTDARRIKDRSHPPHGGMFEVGSTHDHRYSAELEYPDRKGGQPSDHGTPDNLYEVWDNARNRMIGKVRMPGLERGGTDLVESKESVFFYVYADGLLKIFLCNRVPGNLKTPPHS